MSRERKSVRDEPWFKNVPEYMGEVVVRITEAKEAAEDLMDKLMERETALEERSVLLSNFATVLNNREEALVKAVDDMTLFANKMYGPESELTRIHQKLGSIETANTNRHAAYSEQMRAFEENQTRFKDFVMEKFNEIEGQFNEFDRRIGNLEQRLGQGQGQDQKLT